MQASLFSFHCPLGKQIGESTIFKPFFYKKMHIVDGLTTLHL